MKYITTKEELLAAADIRPLVLLCFFTEFDRSRIEFMTKIANDYSQYLKVCFADPNDVSLRIQYQSSLGAIYFLTKTVFSRDLLVRARLVGSDANLENVRSLIPEYADLSLR